MPIVKLDIDSSGAVSGLDRYNKAASNSGKSTDKLTTSTKKGAGGFDKMKLSTESFAKSLFNLPTMIGAVGGALAVKLVGGAIKAASDLEETQGKFNVVFRGMTEDAEAWSKTLQRSYAMSATESKKYLGNLQDLIVPTGMARDAAGELSNNFVQMAADLASFNNLKTSQVIEDIQSALAGSSETMLKYGINVKVSKIQQEALAMGLAKTTDEITEAHKAQALYSIMMREGSDAVGDQIRTQDSYANLLKKSQAIMETTYANIGKAFLPMASAATSAFNDWAIASNGFSKQLGYVVESIRFVHNGFSGLVLIGDGLVVAFAYVFDFLIQGLLGIMAPLDLIGEGLVKLGLQENNPFDKLRAAADTFKESSVQVFNAQYTGIEKTNVMYDKMKAKIQESTSAIYKQPPAIKDVADAIDDVAGSVGDLTGATKGEAASEEILEKKLTAVEAATRQADESFAALATTFRDDAASEAANLRAELDALTATAQQTAAAVDAASSGSSGSSSSGSSSSSGRSVGGIDTSWIYSARPTKVSQGTSGNRTTINVNQSVSRSDIASISNEIDRYGVRS